MRPIIWRSLLIVACMYHCRYGACVSSGPSIDMCVHRHTCPLKDPKRHRCELEDSLCVYWRTLCNMCVCVNWRTVFDMCVCLCVLRNSNSHTCLLKNAICVYWRTLCDMCVHVNWRTVFDACVRVYQGTLIATHVYWRTLFVSIEGLFMLLVCSFLLKDCMWNVLLCVLKNSDSHTCL